jgi:hypothetical protein
MAVNFLFLRRQSLYQERRSINGNKHCSGAGGRPGHKAFAGHQVPAKEMLPIGRKPAVQYVVEELARVGIERILFITGPGKTSIENHFDLDNELIQVLRQNGKEDLLAELSFERAPLQYFYTRQRQQLGLGHGESLVVNAMTHFGRVTVQGHGALLSRDWKRLSALIDENFDTRRRIYKLPAWQVKMVETARRCGASAKFAGSGGAIIGVYRDETMFKELSDRLAAIGSDTIKPIVTG